MITNYKGKGDVWMLKVTSDERVAEGETVMVSSKDKPPREKVVGKFVVKFDDGNSLYEIGGGKPGKPSGGNAFGDAAKCNHCGNDPRSTPAKMSEEIPF